jgi:hypothetical protein
MALSGEIVAFTGKMLVDGAGTTQQECMARAERLGAETREKPSPAVTLVVHGELAGPVKDPSRGYSQKLVDAYDRRAAGYHVHVVDAAGFSDLLRRRPARCRRLRRAPGPSTGTAHITVVAEPDEDVLGVPYVPRHPNGRPRPTGELRVDLAELDKRQRAHEATVSALAAVLAGEGAKPHAPRRGAPQFDLSWRRGRQLYVAEVKTLHATNEVQQVRLGFGQVLDYAVQLGRRGRQIQPVLVLEREPKDDRWKQLAARTGVVLTHAPGFTEVRAPGP